MWLFTNKRKRERRKIEEVLRIKVAESQMALLEAATTTADAAQHVTKALRGQLTDSVRQFESTARLISDALIVCDNKGNIKAFNPVAETVFATSSTEMEQTLVTRLFRIDGKIPTFPELLAAIDGDKDGEIDSPLRGHRCNNESFVSDTAFSRLDRDDGATMFLLLIRDLTDHIEQRNQSTESALRFQSLFNSSFDGILIIQDSFVVAANQEASLIFGVEPNALLQTSSHALLSGGCVQCNKATNSICWYCPTLSSAYKQSGKITRDDGTNINMLFSSTNINWNGKPAYLVTVKDVSEMYQLKKKLNDRANDGKDMICVFGPDFIITFANLYFNSYYDCKKAIGMDLRDLLSPSDRDTFCLKIAQLTPEKPTIRNQIQNFSESGEPRLFDWIDHCIFDENGNVIEYQHTGRDISDLLNELLKQENIQSSY